MGVYTTIEILVLCVTPTVLECVYVATSCKQAVCFSLFDWTDILG